MTSAAVAAYADLVAARSEELIAERDRRSYGAYVRRMAGPRYIDGVHLDELHRHLDAVERGEIRRLIITLPPRHSKSFNVSEHFPAYVLGRNPRKRVIAASHSQPLANRFSRRTRESIRHPRYPFATRIASDLANVERWDTTEGGGYVAVGRGGSPTGEGADLMVIDDPIRSAAEADSETIRESLWEWYRETMRTRLEPGGAIIVTATRWHTDDLSGRLLAEMEAGTGEAWVELHMPAISDEGEALWPERVPLEELEAIRLAVGERAWNAQYQGRPVPLGGGMFPRDWWSEYDELPETFRKLELYVDSAFKTGVKNDYSVFALWGDTGWGDLYLVNLWRAKVEFPELIDLGHEAHEWASEAYPGLKIPLVVEDKASGQSAIQTWGRVQFARDENGLNKRRPISKALPVVRYKVKGTESKISRAEGVTGLAEGGRMFIPRRAPWREAWLVEHEQFPLGKHDDMVDTTAMAGTRLGVRGRRGRVKSF